MPGQPTVPFDGRPFRLGGTSYVVPPLALGAVKRNREKIISIRSGQDPLQHPEMFDHMLDVVHAAIVRNYPELGREQLEELVDMGNIADLFQTVCGQSGFKPVDGPEGNGSGAPAP